MLTRHLPSTDQNRYRTVKRSITRSLLILDTETDSNEVDLDDEYCFFKLICLDSSGLPANSVLSLYSNGVPVVLQDGTTVTFDIAALTGFLWILLPVVGLNNLSLVSDTVATADVSIQITGYERVEY